MDFSWSELLVVGIVALVVIGPKDLPGMFRELGRFTAKIRAMGREFSRAMEQAAKESGVKDVADDLNKVVDPLRKVTNPSSMGLDAVKSAADRFEKWDPLKNAAKPSAPLPVRTPEQVAAAGAVAGVAAQPAAAEAAAAAPPVAAAAAIGPATAELAERQAARKAAAAEAAAKLRTVASEAPVAAPAAAPEKAAKAAKAPGRVRKAKPEGEPT